MPHALLYYRYLSIEINTARTLSLPHTLSLLPHTLSHSLTTTSHSLTLSHYYLTLSHTLSHPSLSPHSLSLPWPLTTSLSLTTLASHNLGLLQSHYQSVCACALPTSCHKHVDDQSASGKNSLAFLPFLSRDFRAQEARNTVAWLHGATTAKRLSRNRPFR